MIDEDGRIQYADALNYVASYEIENGKHVDAIKKISNAI